MNTIPRDAVPCTTNAADLLKHHGKKLVGRTVLTVPFGEWPGGEAKVLRLRPDKGAPEIVFWVKHIKTGDEIGVFDFEPCVVVH